MLYKKFHSFKSSFIYYVQTNSYCEENTNFENVVLGYFALFNSIFLSIKHFPSLGIVPLLKSISEVGSGL